MLRVYTCKWLGLGAPGEVVKPPELIFMYVGLLAEIISTGTGTVCLKVIFHVFDCIRYL